jgi:hypothetical protein
MRPFTGPAEHSPPRVRAGAQGVSAVPGRAVQVLCVSEGNIVFGIRKAC